MKTAQWQQKKNKSLSWRAMGIHVTVVETACGSKYVSSLFDDLNNLNNQLAND
jgi:hypothetical protein